MAPGAKKSPQTPNRSNLAGRKTSQQLILLRQRSLHWPWPECHRNTSRGTRNKSEVQSSHSCCYATSCHQRMTRDFGWLTANRIQWNPALEHCFASPWDPNTSIPRIPRVAATGFEASSSHNSTWAHWDGPGRECSHAACIGLLYVFCQNVRQDLEIL